MSEPSLDAILPLKVDGSYGMDDLRRTDALMASLSAFFSPRLLSQLLVVSPKREVPAVRAYLSRWQALPIDVMAEEDLVPELQRYPKLRGWRKQQLVKLAAGRALTADYCLTLMQMFSVRDLRAEQTYSRVGAHYCNMRIAAFTHAGGHPQHVCWG